MEMLSAFIGFGVATFLFCAYDYFGWGLSAERRRRREFIRKYALSLEAAYKNEKLFCRQVGVKSTKNIRYCFMPSGLAKIDFSVWHEQARLEIRDNEGNMYSVPFNRVDEIELLEAVTRDMKGYVERLPGEGQMRMFN